jgi:hypothetical protein
MRAILRHRPSPAMVVACIALAVALGGTSYAAIKLPANSVGTKQLKKNAVTSRKVKDNAIRGADVNESSLAQVPSAANAATAATAANAVNATNATNATHAANASHATNADQATNAINASFASRATNADFAGEADVANFVASANFGFLSLPNFLDTTATLTIPQAGNWVVIASFEAFNLSATSSNHDTCVLLAGDPLQTNVIDFDVEGAPVDDEEMVFLQIVAHLPDPGHAMLSCTDGGVGDVQAKQLKMTAIQFAAGQIELNRAAGSKKAARALSPG